MFTGLLLTADFNLIAEIAGFFSAVEHAGLGVASPELAQWSKKSTDERR